MTNYRRVIERFSPGRPDQLREHEFYRLSSNHPMEYVSKFYSASRPDGLGVRVTKDLEMVEQYQGRMDSLQVMRVSFGPSEKKFGPAEAAGGGSGRGQREISRIVERFGTGEEVGAANDEEAESNDLDGSVRTENLGRILDTSK